MARLTWVLAVAGLSTMAPAISVVGQAVRHQGHHLPPPVGQALHPGGRQRVRRPGHELAQTATAYQHALYQSALAAGFDRAFLVAAALGGLILLTALIMVRGDRTGIHIAS
jgi:hypothetical protein